jgi:electron transfer flavoprotein-quinone oxidoreductase
MMERFKRHPMVAPLIAGGKSREYMAHWLAEGGYDHIPPLVGDGYLIVGDSAMLFNTLHREGSNLAMVSGRLAAETILKAKRAGDFSRPSLQDYARRLEDGIVFQDIEKYRRFNGFLHRHKEIFTTLPRAAGFAGREMLTVDGVSKKAKQGIIWRRLRRDHSLLGLLRLLRDLARSV